MHLLLPIILLHARVSGHNTNTHKSFIHKFHKGPTWVPHCNFCQCISQDLKIGSANCYSLINPKSLDHKGSCWILLDFYCSVTTLRELGLKKGAQMFNFQYFCMCFTILNVRFRPEGEVRLGSCCERNVT